jgi:hypothetical protein
VVHTLVFIVSTDVTVGVFLLLLSQNSKMHLKVFGRRRVFHVFMYRSI